MQERSTGPGDLVPGVTHGYIAGADPLLPVSPNISIAPTGYTAVPTATSSADGFALFLTQVCIILSLCLLLGQAFKRIGQPKVVGELLAGVLLGPTAFGNIPGFSQTILPQDALPFLKLMAGVGLSLFLFLVGLETDTDIMAAYLRKVVMITLPGMAIPFAIAIGIARLIYEKEVLPVTPDPPKFTTFFLFIATTMAVTSLSVLSRIMAEMGILSTTLGAVTIASGVMNDLIGYVLLALGSALGTGGKQINALYMILAAAGYILALWFLFRPAMMLLLRRSGFEIDPTALPGASDKVPPHLLVIAIVGALTSAFYTDAMGVHPIVGAFAFGVCCPHGLFAVQVTEAVETLVIDILLPLYFVTSGLSTDFKLLNNGVTWGLIVLMVVGIFVSKFSATALSARLAGLPWRKACCVASLMQAKGIIEIIILNVGKDIGVVSPRVFAMLVFCFLSTTMLVRPLSRWIFFSKEAQEAQQSEQRKERDDQDATDEGAGAAATLPVTIALTSVNPSVSALMSFLQIVGHSPMVVDLIRLLPQDDSTSNILRLLAASSTQRLDVMLQALKMHARLAHVPTSLQVAAQRCEERGVALPPGLTHTFTQQHIAQDEDRLPSDTFPLPSSEMVRFIERCNRCAQSRLDMDAAAAGSELGNGLALVAWQGAPVVSTRESWLTTAAYATGLATRSEQGALWQVLQTEPQSMPNRLFAEAESIATGVLLDPLASVPSAHKSGRALEQALGLDTAKRLPRIIVPFFGGNDDRAAVELLIKTASTPGRVDAIVVVCGAAPADLKQGPSVPLPSLPSPGLLGGQGEQPTLHMQTIFRQAAEHADVRFLFGQQADLPEEPAEPDATAEPAGASSPSEGTVLHHGLETTTAANGVRFIQAGPGVDAAVSVIAPLLGLQDFVIVGRGKLGQRPKDFRDKINARYSRLAADRLAAASSSTSSLTNILTNENEERLRAIGRSLGAAAEGLLLGGVSAPMLVVQAKRR